MDHENSTDAMGADVREFRGGSLLFRLLGRKLRIVFDPQRRTFRFDHCMRSRGFWNLIPKAVVECTCDDICEVSFRSQGGWRIIDIKIPEYYATIFDSDLDDFEGLADLMEQFRRNPD